MKIKILMHESEIFPCMKVKFFHAWKWNYHAWRWSFSWKWLSHTWKCFSHAWTILGAKFSFSWREILIPCREIPFLCMNISLSCMEMKFSCIKFSWNDFFMHEIFSRDVISLCLDLSQAQHTTLFVATAWEKVYNLIFRPCSHKLKTLFPKKNIDMFSHASIVIETSLCSYFWQSQYLSRPVASLYLLAYLSVCVAMCVCAYVCMCVCMCA